MFFGSCHFLHRTAVKACQSPRQACVLDSQGTELREQGKCSNLPTLSRAATHSVGSDRAFTSPSVWSPLCVQPITHILVTISPRASSKLEPKGLSALCKGEPAPPGNPQLACHSSSAAINGPGQCSLGRLQQALNLGMRGERDPCSLKQRLFPQMSQSGSSSSRRPA